MRGNSGVQGKKGQIGMAPTGRRELNVREERNVGTMERERKQAAGRRIVA
jgi:hypothetical protein